MSKKDLPAHAGRIVVLAGPAKKRGRYKYVFLRNGEVIHRAEADPNQPSELARTSRQVGNKVPMSHEDCEEFEYQMVRAAEAAELRREAVLRLSENPPLDLEAGILRRGTCPCCDAPYSEGRDFKRAYVCLPTYRQSANLPPEYDAIDCLAEALVLEAERLYCISRVILAIAAEPSICNALGASEGRWFEVCSKPEVVDHLVARGLFRLERPTDVGPVGRLGADTPEPEAS